MEYRKEIDGLRAIAVVSVIFFHAGLKNFSGGFVGVDIFFVISGYLITTIILADLEQNKFFLVDFYERRARRILPALYTIMIICILVSWILLLPNDLRDFSKSIVAATIFSSNILFWRESGYFETESENKPLLHTWSLALEEQYYILFPFLLVFVWRFGKRWVLVFFVLLFSFSFAVAQWACVSKPTAAFFLLPSRGWELLVGAFAAIYLFERELDENYDLFNDIIGWLGLVFILYSILFYNNSTPMPGVYALVPTLGSVLIIIFASKTTSVGRFIGNKYFATIGLISYSAYLWHQPIFAFYRYRFEDNENHIFIILLVLMVFGASFVTWRAVEQPFRNKNIFSRKLIFGLSLSFGLSLILIGIIGLKANGFLDSKRWDRIRYAQTVLNEKGSGNNFCNDNQINISLTPYHVCLIGDLNVAPEGALWGDSYASALLYGLNEELLRENKSFYAILSDGCVPIVGASKKSLQFDCNNERHRLFFENFIKDSKLKKLVWYGSFSRLTGQQSNPDYLLDLKPATQDHFRNRIIEMAQSLKKSHKETVFISNTPMFTNSVPEYISRMYLLRHNSKSGIQVVDKEILRNNYGLNVKFLQSLGSYLNVIDGLDALCEGISCSSQDVNGEILYLDKEHISHFTSKKLAKIAIDKLYKKHD